MTKITASVLTLLLAVGCGSGQGSTGQTPGKAEVTSVQGETGSSGAPGAPGATGLQGPAGAQGAMGLPGKDGKDGADGTNGVDGKDGSMGLQGAQGPTGPQGQPGTSTPITKASLYTVTGANTIIPGFGSGTFQTSASCTKGDNDFVLTGGCHAGVLEITDTNEANESDPTLASFFSCSVYYPGGGTGAVIYATAVCVHVP